MTAVRLARTELRRLTAGKLPKLALLAVTLVPLLYGALYLYANWDPYKNLTNVPAALVVQDRGADGPDGQPMHAGRDVADKLANSDTFSWRSTDARDAAAGVADGRYSFALTVPANFSAALASPGDFQPEQAKLHVTTNDANNYLVGTIADQVVSEIRHQVSSGAGQQAADQLLLGLGTVHDKTVEVADGAGQLADGAGQLGTGIDQANAGTEELAGGAHQLVDGQRQLLDGSGALVDGSGRAAGGADKLATGNQQLAGGLGELREQTHDLPDKTERLADGAERVADGNEQLASRAEQLGGISGELTNNLTQTRDRIAGQLRSAGVPEEQVDKVVEGINDLNKPVTDADGRVQGTVGQMRQLADGAHQVADGNRQLADATPRMTGAIGQAADGAERLSQGADTLAEGNEQLHDGAVRLRDGQHRALDGGTELAGGADRLHDGADQLATGSTRLVDGSHELAGKLRDGSGDIPHPGERAREDTARTIGDPVAIDSKEQVSAGTYGAGLAPFFMGLALWIGGFVLFLLLRPLSSRALAAGVAPWRTALGGWLPAGLVGIVQAVLLFTVVVFGVGVSPANPLATLGFLILTSFAFTAVVHALNSAFGPRGKFIALILLVLQLVTAGGTFPWQTIPGALQPLHQVLPLSYVVQALRPLLYGGALGGAVTTGVWVLLSYILGGLLLSTVAAWRQRVWTPSKLKPELAL